MNYRTAKRLEGIINRSNIATVVLMQEPRRGTYKLLIRWIDSGVVRDIHTPAEWEDLTGMSVPR